jgi:O-antigen ligase
MSLFPNSKERFIDKTIYDFTRNSDDKLYIFSKPHTDMYLTAYRLYLDNKFFGVGPRQFRNSCNEYSVSKYSCETHPHNTYLELMSEAGIFAFLIVMGLFVLISYLSIKHFLFKFTQDKKNIINDFEVCLLSAIMISLWPFSPSGSFLNNWMSIIYYLPVGLLLWQRSKHKNSIKN